MSTSEVNAILESMGIIPGDANLDGMVNSVDLNAVGVHWQQSGCLGWGQGDFNGDNVVNSVDLNVLGVNWQRGAAVAAEAGHVPRAPLSSNLVVVNAVEEAEPTKTAQTDNRFVTATDDDTNQQTATKLSRYERTKTRSTIARRGNNNSQVKLIDIALAELDD